MITNTTRVHMNKVSLWFISICVQMSPIVSTNTPHAFITSCCYYNLDKRGHFQVFVSEFRHHIILEYGDMLHGIALPNFKSRLKYKWNACFSYWNFKVVLLWICSMKNRSGNKLNFVLKNTACADNVKSFELYIKNVCYFRQTSK